MLVRQVIDSLLADGVAADRILYVPFDEIASLGRLRDPILAIARWYESRVLGRTPRIIPISLSTLLWLR